MYILFVYWYILSLTDSEQSRFCRLDFVLMPKAYNCWYAFVPYLIIAGSKQHNNITIKSILFFVDCKKWFFLHHIMLSSGDCNWFIS